MRIYSTEECMEFVGYKSLYSNPIKQFVFTVPTVTNAHCIADIEGKKFHHNEHLIEDICGEVLIKYPQLAPILEKLNIYLCPYPCLEFNNATMYGDYAMLLFARGTQIPSLMTKYIVPHELGHAIQDYYARERWKHGAKWREYLELRNAPRGICRIWDDDINDFSNKESYLCIDGNHEQKPKDWDKKPSEWFAEDIRHLFGVLPSTTWELTTVEPPNDKIKEWIENLKEKCE